MKFNYSENRIYLNDEAGKTIAEVTFPVVSKDVVNIDHTFVDDSLRGQGIANALLLAVAQELRKTQKKAFPTCSYAVRWFSTHPEFWDVYTDHI